MKKMKIIYFIAIVLLMFPLTACSVSDIQLIYELNGGEVDTDNPNTFLLEDESIELVNPSKSGYDYGYWYLDKELTNQVDTLTHDLIEELNSKTITLYAGYSDVSIIFKDTDIDGDTHNYLYFGKYPQFVETNTVITNELDKLTTTNSNDYYEYNNIEYKKTVANVYASYTWSNGEKAIKNETYYFKVEPIKWRIIQNDSKITVISEYVIDQSVFYSSQDTRDINDKTIYSNNYEHSDLRTFLNNEFLNRAFTSSQQNLIAFTNIDNSSITTNNIVNQYTSNNTYDRVYALSYQDSLNESYGFSNSTDSSSSRKAVLTDYAMAQYVFKDGVCGSWLLRSPRYDEDSLISRVNNYGNVSSTMTDGLYNGVRPVFKFL